MEALWLDDIHVTGHLYPARPRTARPASTWRVWSMRWNAWWSAAPNSCARVWFLVAKTSKSGVTRVTHSQEEI